MDYIRARLKRMHDRNILKNKAVNVMIQVRLNTFKKQCNKVESDVRLTKQAYHQLSSFNEYFGDSTKTWQTINELTLL